MKMPVAIFATCLPAMLLAADQPDSADAIQGVWRSTRALDQHTLIFCGDTLIGRVGTDPITGEMVSTFQAIQDCGTIDIQRPDGLQLGRYKVDGNKLTLMLADVGQLRPDSIDFPFPGTAIPTKFPIQMSRRGQAPRTSSRYVFERER